ncbi:MAG: threonine synthase [Bacteroidales bacterium]
MSSKYQYRCIDCGKSYSGTGIRYLCPECSTSNRTDRPPRGLLKVEYDYETIAAGLKNPGTLQDSGWLELLPLHSIDSLPPVTVGNTPLEHYIEKDQKGRPHHLFLKNDTLNPTWSLKDRASALVSAWAREEGYRTIVTASTGNAGSSLAGICAANNQNAIVLVPEKAPAAKLVQVMMYGARLVPVKGSYDDAFRLSVEISEQYGWVNRNTAYNPLTVEGKKTVAFEIQAQTAGQLPDRIFVPTGDGVILSGVYKGFEDLLKLGLIDRMPVIVAVQSTGSDNLVRNLDNEIFDARTAHTIADSISVDVPAGFYMARQFLKNYHGEHTIVSDEEILEASYLLASEKGLFAEPAAAAAWAGYLKFKNDGALNPESRNLVLLTGAGLKDIRAVEPGLRFPEAIPAETDAFAKVFKEASG